MGWVCSVCGDEHGEALRDIRLGLPDPIFELSEVEREERAELGDDWCLLVDRSGEVRHFVRGLLHLPIPDEAGDFRYGVWVEVDAASYEGLADRWHDPDGGESQPFFGLLANELAAYPDTQGVPVALQLRDVKILPAAIVLDAAHPLGRAQRSGIDVDDANRLAETVLH